MDTNQFKIQHSKSQENPEVISVQGFTYLDSPVKSDETVDTELVEISPNNKDCLLKVTQNSFKNKTYSNYFVKVGGNLQGLYHPWSMFTEGTIKNFDKAHGRMAYTFKKVPKKIFDEYAKFLKTRNNTYYISAERLLKDVR